MSLLLFVVVMEVYNRIIQLQIKEKVFHYYPRCRSLKMCHLSFVDDLLIFWKADTESVSCLI